MGRSTLGSVRRMRSGRYQARVTVNGRKTPLGTFATRTEARQAIAGWTVTQKSPTPRRSMTVEAWSKEWSQTRVGHRPTTRCRDQLIIDSHILPVFGELELGEVTAADVQ